MIQILQTNYDPCISRNEKKCLKKHPKFLDLYESVYGNYILFETKIILIGLALRKPQ